MKINFTVRLTNKILVHLNASWNTQKEILLWNRIYWTMRENKTKLWFKVKIWFILNPSTYFVFNNSSADGLYTHHIGGGTRNIWPPNIFGCGSKIFSCKNLMKYFSPWGAGCSCEGFVNKIHNKFGNKYFLLECENLFLKKSEITFWQ